MAASSMIMINGASLSSYDPIVSSLDDSSSLATGTEMTQEADLFPEPSPEPEQVGPDSLKPDPGLQ